MNTLKELAEKVASTINQPFNFELKERVKNSFKQILATNIRRSFETNGIDDTLKLNYSIEVTPYDKVAEDLYNITNQSITIKNVNYKLKTVDKVLPSIRFRNEAPFTKVSGVNGGLIPYFAKAETEINYSSPFRSPISYHLDNGYLVVSSTIFDDRLKIRYINIESIFEDMAAVLTYYNDTLDDEDVSIPIPADMIGMIFQEILKIEFGITRPEEINVPIANDIQQQKG